MASEPLRSRLSFLLVFLAASPFALGNDGCGASSTEVTLCGDQVCGDDERCVATADGGVCRPKVEVCPEIYAPVCGVDGKTYPNECHARAAGVEVGSVGECGGEVCGGIAGFTCPEGQFCNYPIEARCGAADQTGVCRPRPEVCTDVYEPVCGCDDRTYGNACEAASRGVSVRAEGECDCLPPPCARPPEGCRYEGATACTCGELVCDDCAIVDCAPPPPGCTVIDDGSCCGAVVCPE